MWVFGLCDHGLGFFGGGYENMSGIHNSELMGARLVYHLLNKTGGKDFDSIENVGFCKC